MTSPTDRLTLLETFLRIAERGSISAAARDLDLSQASASRRLTALEGVLGGPLAARSTHELALTDLGRATLLRARVLIDGWEELMEASEVDLGLRGRLRVVAPVGLGAGPLAESVSSFLADHPEVQIEWHLDDGQLRMTQSPADLWIRIGEVQDDRLHVREIGRVERHVVGASELVSRVGARDPADLVGAPTLALGPFDAAVWRLRQGRKRRTVRVAPSASTDSIAALHAFAVAGAGFAILPRWMTGADLGEGRLAEALPGWTAEPLPLRLASLPLARKSARLRAFVNHIEDALAGLCDLGGAG